MHMMLIDAGGTISSIPDADGRLVGAEGGLDAGTTGDAPFLRQQVYAGLSEEMTLADMAAVRDAVLAAVADPDVGGVIVAHGTDAMEETAFLTDLSLPATKPVIFTGAMLPLTQANSDGTRNLADAMRAARDPALALCGALVCFAGHLIPAAQVYKYSSTAIDGFGWRGGEAGRVDPARIIPPPRTARPAPLPAVLPVNACPIIAISGGDDGWMIDAAVAHGARAMVLMALGRGNASERACAATARAVAAGVPVVIASRCPTGGTAGDYATGQRLVGAGALFAGDLGPTQARILMSCLLALDVTPDAIAAEIARRAHFLPVG
jgi:L-asparaginase